MDQAQARSLLFGQGVIAPFYLRAPQLDIYELLLRERNPFIECCRRFGKTTSILVFIFEQLIQNPGWVCTWASPWKSQTRDIVMPEADILFRMAPEAIRPKFQTMDSFYRFPNGSRLKLRGVNDDRGESARGPFAHLIVADEFGTWKDPDYIVQSALRPQLETTNGPFIFASTPPEDLGHAYYLHKERAIKEGRFIQKTWRDKVWLTPEKIAELASDYGGMETPAWRREQNCEEVADSAMLVCPEYDEARNDLEDAAPRPAFFDIYTAGDSGADDNTAVLFLYHDFETDTTVFEDEWVKNGKTTAEVIQAAKDKELTLWGTKPGCACQLAPYEIGPKVCLTHGPQPYRRVYDADKQLLIDITCTMQYPVELPEKADKVAAIRFFRRQVQLGRVKIRKRCKILRRQLKVGRWANEKHLDFQRSPDEELKHLDALVSAIYAVRSVIRSHNPFPKDVGVGIYTHHLTPEYVSQGSSQLERSLSGLDPFGDGGF